MNEMVYMDYDLKLICCLFFAIIILLIIRRILIDKLTSEDLEISIRSVLGREEIQEDYMNIIERPYGTLAILADGFGKNEAGKTASKVAVNFITEMFIKENSSNKIAYFFKKALMKANHEVIERIERDAGGTSVTVAFIKDNYLHYALVGNVMLAIFRGRELVKLSEGHNIDEIAKKAYVEGKVVKEDALYTMEREKLIYYLGKEPLSEIEISEEIYAKALYQKTVEENENVGIQIETSQTPVIPIETRKIMNRNKGIYENIRWIEIEDVLEDRTLDLEGKSDLIINRLNVRQNGSIILMKYCSK